MEYTCLIVDDERPALKLLKAYIEKLPHLKLIGSCENAMQAIVALERESPDLLFLDIHMPELTGLELLRVLKVKPQVIMTTAYREFAVEGFALDVTDYLVKPFSFERFTQAVNKAIEQVKLRRKTLPNPIAAPTSEDQSPLQDHFFARTHHKLEKIILSEILYLESMREYVAIHTINKRFVITQTMRNMEEELPKEQFFRVHRSYIVALDHIREMYGNIIVIGEKEIPIGASYRKAFFDQVRQL